MLCAGGNDVPDAREIHQEPLWALWFQHLAGLVPVSALRVSQHANVTTNAWRPASACVHSPQSL